MPTSAEILAEFEAQIPKVQKKQEELGERAIKASTIPESKNGVELTWEDTGDTYYEDEKYICWNGLCVEKEINTTSSENEN
ncbi:hypothetical protein LCGC14_1454400 [marine sediment metagenome]|uniref:Uncharacterized protein n=1 Tax=marine sediment metagenome TaxID=412755 RepID=A0A0F9JGW1_9ZZZZ